MSTVKCHGELITCDNLTTVPKFLRITLHQTHQTNTKYFFIISAKWIFYSWI